MNTLEKQDIFIFKRDKKIELKDNITFAVPIKDRNVEEIRNCLKNDMTIFLDQGLELNPDKVYMFGDTSNIPNDIFKGFPIESLWYATIKDYKTREYETVDRTNVMSIHEYYNKKEILKLAISMLGNPKNIIVANIRYSDYKTSKFYNKYIKPKFIQE